MDMTATQNKYLIRMFFLSWTPRFMSNTHTHMHTHTELKQLIVFEASKFWAEYNINIYFILLSSYNCVI